MAKIETIAVVGAGQMGLGIAELCASKNYQVQLFDSNSQILNNAKIRLTASGLKLVEKGKITSVLQAQIINNIQTFNDLSKLKDADLIIEAVIESYDVKSSLFKNLSAVAKESAILASNTSSLSITRMANSFIRPDKFIGLHFFNPAPVMPLVEVIAGLKTSLTTKQLVIAFAQTLEKEAITANDTPGFIVNRILCPMINEAIFLLAEGNNAQEIDQALKLGANHPMGPLQLADFVGLDTLLRILEIYQEEFGEDKYRPCPLLRQYVNAGWLGRKSGKGFYTY